MKTSKIEFRKKGLINENFYHINFLKELSSLQFIINNNKHANDEIFDTYINKYIENEHNINLLNAFFSYYKTTGKNFLLNGLLNYYHLNKIHLINCYFENYKKRIWEKIRNYIIFICF